MTTIIIAAIVIAITYSLIQILLGLAEILYGILLFLLAGVLQVAIILLAVTGFFWRAACGE
jgi:hypothetical protein